MSLPEASKPSHSRIAEGSSLIGANFCDKLNLKIQLNCNQQSKPIRKSLASFGAMGIISNCLP
jgi:hypothetical protein